MNITNEDVQDILHLLDATSYNELNVQTERFRLSLRRTDGTWTQSAQVLAPANLLYPQGGVATAAKLGVAGSEAAANASDGQIEVKAPLVGTFYRTPKPGSPPFVEVGSSVDQDTLIGIIETMKLMNSVYAGAKGKIVEICVENGQLAEQNTVLMRIEPEAL